MSHEPRHAPGRPSWDCVECGQPWPCPPAQVDLAEEFGADRVGLAMLLGSHLVDAAREVGRVPAVELHERFVAWTR